MGTTTLNNAAVLSRLCCTNGLGMGPCGHGYGYWYGYIIMLIGIGMGMNMGMAMCEGKMQGGRLVDGRLCGAHIQKAEPVGTLPFVSSLSWLLKALCF